MIEAYTRERTRSAAPVMPFVDLDVGAVDIRDAALSFAFAVGMLIVAAGGALILKYSFTADYWNFLSGGFGLLVSLVATYMGAAVVRLTLTRWQAHQERIEAWDKAALTSYVNLGGGIISEEVTEYSFSADNPLHVLWVAIDVQRRIAEGEDTPYSTRNLRGPMFYGSRRVGELSKAQAERMAQRLAALGFIQGRQEGYAGRWCVESYDQMIAAVRGARWA